MRIVEGGTGKVEGGNGVKVGKVGTSFALQVQDMVYGWRARGGPDRVPGGGRDSRSLAAFCSASCWNDYWKISQPA